jgi:putative selenium metabolism hydrolase
MIHAGRIIKELGLNDQFSIYFTATVMEEDCDGLCWQYILNEDGLAPELVVITEPTNLNIYRGHRGRMEIRVEVKGKSCHGSAPERGDNAIYKIARIALEIEKLNTRLRDDPFLGKGTVTISEVKSSSPSLCAVADEAGIHLDRRLTFGETKDSALAEVRDAAARAGYPDAKVYVLTYEEAAYTGKVYPTEKYYPTWVLDESSPFLKGAVAAYSGVLGKKPLVDKWTFSTNGIATMGMKGIPTFGLGPGNEIYAHAANEACPVEHLSAAVAFYAALVAKLNGKV